MTLTTLERPALVPDEGAKTYLLLETEALEDHLRIQANAAEPPSILRAVKDIDFATFTAWVWDRTEYEAHAQRGPLLVHMEPDSPLLATFYDAWVSSDAGVLIASNADMEEVLAHLRSMLFVYLPDGAKARFRLQETLTLSSVLRALSPHRAASLLGPLSQMVWRENVAPAEHLWWRYIQQDRAHAASGPFQFTHQEMMAIERYQAEQRLNAQVALTREAPQSFRGDAREQTVQWISQLQHWGFQRQGDIASGLDIFRHDGFAAAAPAVTQILANTTLAAGARVTQAANLLHGYGV